MNLPSFAALVGAALILASCLPETLQTAKKKEEAFFLKPASFAGLAGWQDDAQQEALEAFRKSCTRIMKKNPEDGFGAFAGAYGDWQPLCEKTSLLLLGTADEARAFFEENFNVYAVHGDKGAEGLFTGYYEPRLKGSYEKKDGYAVPLYARPDDLVTVNLGDFREDLKGETVMGRVAGEKLVPYHKRAEIEAGALAGAEKEIVWVDSAVDAFFLHIQGSGQVEMEDGTVLRVGYAAQNGHAYLAVGKALIERGEMAKENVSMQTIRAWLEANPDKAQEVMNLNNSYVFFKALDGDGPLGAEGVALTPKRSLAVDRKKFAYGIPLWLDAEEPEGGARLRRLMVAQDTGGAIRGSVRGDFFWGAGDEAAHKAGLMKSKGVFYALLPKSVTVPEAYAAPRKARRGFQYND